MPYMKMNEEVKFRNHETKSHQGNACPDPGQEGPLVGQKSPVVGLLGQDDSPPSSPGLVFPIFEPDVHVALGAVADQVSWLHAHEFSHRFKLVYMDPPFYSNKDYGAFSDEWTSLNEYLDEMKGWLHSIRPWIHESGFLVLHCDYHASHYLKVMGDEIFGYPNFRNEWVWHYTGRRTPAALHVNSKHDVLLVWAKSPAARMNPVYDDWNRDDYVAMKKQKVHRDETGREWIWGHQGRGKSHAYRIYLDEHVSRGRAIDTVWDIPIINTSAKERLGYPTQKPLALLKRVIALTTNTDDWVADFACGSGTTGAAALSMGRRVWLGDQNPEAVQITQKRLSES